MRKILISGYYGFSNAGDEAMLTAIVTGLRAQDPQVELTVLSGHPELTQSLQQVKSIHRFNALGILRAMWHTDLLLSGGGSLLQNVTSQVSLFYYLSIIGLASLFGKKSCFLLRASALSTGGLPAGSHIKSAKEQI